MEPTKAKEPTKARERMGIMGAMLLMGWWGTRRNRGAHQGWLSPWQSPPSPPGYSAKKVSDSKRSQRCINADGWYFSGQPQWLLMEVVGRLWRLAPASLLQNKEEDHDDKDHPVSPLLPSSSSPLWRLRLPKQPDCHNETDKVYLKVEVHTKLTSKLRHIKIIPQIRKKGGRQGLYWYQFWTHQSWIDWLWKPINQFLILNYWSCAVTYEAPPDACGCSSTNFNLEHKKHLNFWSHCSGRCETKQVNVIFISFNCHVWQLEIIICRTSKKVFNIWDNKAEPIWIG